MVLSLMLKQTKRNLKADISLCYYENRKDFVARYI